MPWGRPSREPVSVEEQLRVRRMIWLRFWGPSLTVLLLGFALAFYFMQPAPPKSLVLATGDPEGAYHAYALRYRALMAKEGIDLELRPTAGAMENLALLRTGQVSVAFVQGGTTERSGEPGLESLASLFLEPVWVIVRGTDEADGLAGLRGQRVAIGESGSGTRLIAETFLRDNGLEGAYTLVDAGGREAVEALRSGSADAAFFVTAPTSPLLRELTNGDGFRLVPFPRQRAYAARYPYLAPVTLGEGTLDLARNIPPTDIPLVAARSMLVAHEDLHPALVTLLLKVAKESGAPRGVFGTAGIAPPPQLDGLSPRREALRFFAMGPSILQRYLPFWAAALIDQLKIMLLPLITLLLPLTKIGPPIYVWRTRFKIYRWYRILHAIDQVHKRGLSPKTIDADIARVRALEKELTEIHVPLSYMTEFYDLHIHISYVLRRLQEMAEKRRRAEAGDGQTPTEPADR